MQPETHSTRLTLIERVCSEEREERSWEDFVVCYKAYIYFIIRRFDLGMDLTEDLLQEVLLRLWKDLPKFEYRPGQCRFRTWLSLVTGNVVRTYLKSKAGRNSKAEIHYDDALHALDKISEPEIEKMAETEWKLFIAEKALENIKPRLSHKLLTVFEASLNETADSTVAENLGITEASVRVYRQRVRNALMKEIIRLNSELDA